MGKMPARKKNLRRLSASQRVWSPHVPVKGRPGMRQRLLKGQIGKKKKKP